MATFDAGSWDVVQPQNRVDIRPLMKMVYLWMGLGLGITAVLAIVFGNMFQQDPTLLRPEIMIVAIVIEIGLVIALGAAINRLSPTVAAVMFVVYSALNGFTLSYIFLVYELGTIYSAFFTAAALFGAMSLVGYTTSIDLTQYRSYFMMGLIGLIIAMVVNIFLRSDGFDFLISIVGVILFTALTAYDTQKLARMANHPDMQSAGVAMSRLSILGALTLYLDFINLFLFLLRIFGRRD